MRFLILFLFLALSVVWSCMHTTPQVNAQASDPLDSAQVRTLFVQRCGICHGADGHSPIQGARDLAESTLSRDEVLTQIMNGKGTMPPFRHLDVPVLEALADYTMALRKP